MMLGLLRQQELNRMDGELFRLKNSPPVPIAKLVPNHHSGVPWHIPVPRQSGVFMSLRGGDHTVEQSDCIAYVRGLAFYRAWLTSGESHYQACPLQQDMPKDYKCHNAIKGFAEGIGNPLPIANMGTLTRDGKLVIHSVDGITGTLWLLAQNLEVFPVLCHDLTSASLLVDKAAVAAPVAVSML